MQDFKNFFELDNNGIIHYVHSDNYSIFIVYEDIEDNKIYRITLDKEYVVTSTSEIDISEMQEAFKFIKWHRPVVNNRNELIFTGCVTIESKGTYRFNISESKLSLTETVKINDSFEFKNFKCLNDFEVDHHIQKGNYLYVVGWDTRLNMYSFMQVHIGKDKAIRRYLFDSDQGQLIIHSFNIDSWGGRIYIAGEVKITSNEQDVVTSIPYLETFCYYKPTTFQSD